MGGSGGGSGTTQLSAYACAHASRESSSLNSTTPVLTLSNNSLWHS